MLLLWAHSQVDNRVRVTRVRNDGPYAKARGPLAFALPVPRQIYRNTSGQRAAVRRRPDTGVGQTVQAAGKGIAP